MNTWCTPGLSGTQGHWKIENAFNYVTFQREKNIPKKDDTSKFFEVPLMFPSPNVRQFMRMKAAFISWFFDFFFLSFPFSLVPSNQKSMGIDTYLLDNTEIWTADILF